MKAPLPAALAAPLLLVGAWLRWQQRPWHSNVWGVDWLIYYEPQARALRRGDLLHWLLSWEGLHPPLSGVIHSTAMALGASWSVHWGLTVGACLGGSAWLAGSLGRRLHPAAGLLLLLWACLSPLQVNYGLNTSPYPWQLLLVAGSTALLLWAVEQSEPRAWLLAGVAAALCAQVHVLAFAAVLGQALFLMLHGPRRWRAWGRPALGWLAPVVLSALVVVVVSLTKTADPWTFHVEPEEPWWRTARLVLAGRFGDGWRAGLGPALGLGALAGLAGGARREVALLLLQILGMLAALALFLDLGVADSRLTHYYLVPQLLLFAAGAAGWVGLALRWGGPGPWRRLPAGAAPWVLAGLVAASQLGWIQQNWRWLGDRHDTARATMAASPAEPVRALYDAAGEGDAVVYLWGPTFLNDEPENLDPVGAAWPLRRLARPCFDVEAPRQHCVQHGGARFFFAPNPFTGPLDGVEEELRLLVNSAHAPGRATFLFHPQPDAAARPWPAEQWLRDQGGVGEELGSVLVVRMPPGAHIVEVPMHPDPGGDPDERPDGDRGERTDPIEDPSSP